MVIAIVVYGRDAEEISLPTLCDYFLCEVGCISKAFQIAPEHLGDLNKGASRYTLCI